jgi:hypothetical protein
MLIAFLRHRAPGEVFRFLFSDVGFPPPVEEDVHFQETRWLRVLTIAGTNG